MQNSKPYESYDHDELEPGAHLTIERTLYYRDTADLTPYIALTLTELQAMREKSSATENDLFQRLKSIADEWEVQGAKTLMIDKAIQYVNTPQQQHTENEWVKKDYHYEISNRVYKMTYRVIPVTIRNWDTNTDEIVGWTVTWDVYVNNPGTVQHPTIIAGQRDKRFASDVEARKYLMGRIKAYSHLFTEISPKVPKEYAQNFRVSGQLLPGYVLEEKAPEHSKTKDHER